MASQIDRVGAYRGNIMESGVGATKREFPQFVGRFVASEKWVEGAEMEAFGITEPAWVDWSAYEQEMTGYLILLSDDKTTGETVELFHMDSLRKALGWDGTSFGVLGSTDWSKQKVTFWVEENEWNGKVDLKINAIDVADAPANRTIRKMDTDGLKNLDSKFAGVLKKAAPAAKAVSAAKAPATPPKAGATPPKPSGPHAAVPGKAASGAKAAVTPTTASAPSAPSGATAAPSPSKTPPKGPPKVSKPAAPAATEEAPFEAGMTMDEAWAHVLANKGAATDDTMAEKWIDASTAVAPGKNEDTMTPAEWKAIGEKTLELLAA